MSVSWSEADNTVTVGGHVYHVPVTVAADIIGDYTISTISTIHGDYETVVFDLGDDNVFEHHYTSEAEARAGHNWLVVQLSDGAHPDNLEVPRCGRCGDRGEIASPAVGSPACLEPTVPCPTCGGV